jgi:hypothetical protein
MDSAGSLKRHCSTSHELMFTFVPNNFGSSNVKKLAMYFISVLSMFKTELPCFDWKHELQQF